MLACVRTAALFGIEACQVHVEVDVTFGLPAFTVVGLPDAGVRESRDRVRTAIRNSGFEFPAHRVTVNLAPADIRKAGASFDLPIALGILAATGLVTRRDIDDVVVIGELSLDGGIQTARGVLPIAAAARRERLGGLLLPSRNRREASAVEGLALYPVRSLGEAVEALNDLTAFNISDVALVGGGSVPHPGEISLAHHGVLFLDEMPEFSRHVLEVLRQPLEEGCIRIARSARTAVFPAGFMLVGAMNPCPCGYLNHPQRACRCSPLQIARYASRLSGPLRDRMDLTVGVSAVPARDLTEAVSGEQSDAIRTRVIAARLRQSTRDGDGRLNARMRGRALRLHARLDTAARRLLDRALHRLSVSARGHDRLLRVARTIADLDSATVIGADHVAEALQFRNEDAVMPACDAASTG
ncbi:MAG: ATP-binding protein [Acidobacteria bacterium]|nr:ATP-binding protein [Acidobacteriota bacterium]